MNSPDVRSTTIFVVRLCSRRQGPSRYASLDGYVNRLLKVSTRISLSVFSPSDDATSVKIVD